jgi:hypothetical protein
VTSLGGERERGVWRNQEGFSVRFQTPPLARLADRVSFAQAALRSDCTAKAAASGTLASIAKRPSAIRAGFHEGQGPPIKGGLRPEPQTLAYQRSLLRRDGWHVDGLEHGGAGAVEPQAERCAPRPQ